MQFSRGDLPHPHLGISFIFVPFFMAGVTGLEPAASGVTGQRSNQLSYTPFKNAIQDNY